MKIYNCIDSLMNINNQCNNFDNKLLNNNENIRNICVKTDNVINQKLDMYSHNTDNDINYLKDLIILLNNK